MFDILDANMPLDVVGMGDRYPGASPRRGFSGVSMGRVGEVWVRNVDSREPHRRSLLLHAGIKESSYFDKHLLSLLLAVTTRSGC